MHTYIEYTHTHTHTLSLSLSLSHTHTHIYICTYYTHQPPCFLLDPHTSTYTTTYICAYMNSCLHKKNKNTHA